MRRGQQLAEAAASFLGAPFRLYGRDAKHGLDCVGLVITRLRAIGIEPAIPVGYGLRNRSIERWLSHADQSSLVTVKAPILPGDILLVRSGPHQQHLMIAEHEATVIHAHAGLRRVVREPFEWRTTCLNQWRLHD